MAGDDVVADRDTGTADSDKADAVRTIVAKKIKETRDGGLEFNGRLDNLMIGRQ
jgi:hypothetical protein